MGLGEITKQFAKEAIESQVKDVLSIPETPAAEKPGVQQHGLAVKETAGIRRFGYPVHAVVQLARPVTTRDRFRLLDS